MQALRRKLREPVAIPFQTATRGHARPQASSAQTAFKAAVRAREGIHRRRRHHAGRALAAHARPFAASPLSLYRALRSLNPSPYMFYYDFGDFHVVGASPEILVRKDGGRSRATDRRHAPARHDARRGRARSRSELLADPKESAEHVMLIDLGRNDVGRVAKTGSVEVTDRWSIERYSHVMHIVSNVEGTLQAGPHAASTCCARRFPPAR